MRLMSGFVLTAACALPITATAEDIDFFAPHAEVTAQVAAQLWDFAELGYQETRSSALLQQTLTDAGFRVESGVAEIPTAFVASYGEGTPVIAILAEFDALPGITQAAVPQRTPLPDKPAGQACGHNLFGAGSLGAALAVRDWLASSGHSGTIRLYGTPAEEGGSGKVYMVRAGLFEDVDVALHWHPGDMNTAAAATTLANRSAKFRFHGVSTHAARSPEKGRSALDGVEAFNYMSNLMREHLPEQARMHYVITNGGQAPNVVPDFAEVFYYLRHPEAKTLLELWPRLEQAAQGAALGTGTTVDWEIIHGNHPVLINQTLAQVLDTQLREVGGIEYTAQEHAFAEEIRATMNNPGNPLGSERDVTDFGIIQGYGSTDVGDVSIAVPTGGIYVATWVPGTAPHSWQAVAASGMSIGQKGAQNAARVLYRATVELMRNPQHIATAKAEHAKALGDDFRYEALLGDRAPPLDYRGSPH